MENQQLTATTLAGLEEVLAEELKGLGAFDVKIGRRAVTFSGDKKMIYRANYYLRTALRVLVQLDSFRFRNADDLYRKAKRILWEDYIELDQTFAIHHTVYSDMFKNSMFASLKVKDAIVDRFRQRFNKRPSIDPRTPDIPISLHISNDVCTISLDSSGESLHKRGYRVAQTEAPINEVLAAGLIKLSGWNGKQNFLDPMCGSGTLVIEAAMLANNIAPGSIRKRFAFQKWRSYNAAFYQMITCEQKQKTQEGKIVGADVLRSAIDIAYKNAEAAGVLKNIDFKISNYKYFDSGLKNPFLLFNPPYGERINPEDRDFYSMVGERLKHHYEDTTAWIISTSACLKSIGLRPSKKISLLNGSIECSFRKYELYKGSKKTN